MESMTRAQGWRFPDMGRRLERGAWIATLLDACLVEPARDDEARAARGAARGRRQRDDLPPPLPGRRCRRAPVLDLLLPTRPTRARSPSSSRRSTQHLSSCRARSKARRAHAEERIALGALARVRLADVAELCRARGGQARAARPSCCRARVGDLPALSDALTRSYLSARRRVAAHRDASRSDRELPRHATRRPTTTTSRSRSCHNELRLDAARDRHAAARSAPQLRDRAGAVGARAGSSTTSATRPTSSRVEEPHDRMVLIGARARSSVARARRRRRSWTAGVGGGARRRARATRGPAGSTRSSSCFESPLVAGRARARGVRRAVVRRRAGRCSRRRSTSPAASTPTSRTTRRDLGRHAGRRRAARARAASARTSRTSRSPACARSACPRAT